jgi:DNA-binding MarR family transcriptional regulator
MPPRPSAASPPLPDDADSVDLGVLKDVLGFRMRRIQAHLLKSFADRLADRALKPAEFSALALIGANPGISQTRLAVEAGFDKTALVVLIDDLERWGWAERKRALGDRRRHALQITPAGEIVLRELVEIGKASEAAIMQGLGAAERRRFFASLDRVYRLCFDDDAG